MVELYSKWNVEEATTDKEKNKTLDISGGFFGNLPPYFFFTASSCRNRFTVNEISQHNNIL
jgi:hypothetical protein